MSLHCVHNELAMNPQWIHIEECLTTSQRLHNDFVMIPQYLSNAIAYQFAMGSHFVRNRVCTGTLRKSRAIWQHVSACLGGGGLSGPAASAEWMAENARRLLADIWQIYTSREHSEDICTNTCFHLMCSPDAAKGVHRNIAEVTSDLAETCSTFLHAWEAAP